MELILVLVIVSLAALWLVLRTLSKRRKNRDCPPACGATCGGCFKSTLVLLLCMPLAGRAADTVEVWDAGAADVDFYLGVDGLGDHGLDGAWGELMVGYGVVDGLSVYLTSRLEGDASFTSGQPGFSLGVFGTPVDTRMFDLDLFLDIGAGGEALRAFTVTPSLEMNFDFGDASLGWGTYLRTGVPVYGQVEAEQPSGPHYCIELELGGWFKLSEQHQVLLEFDFDLHPEPAPGERNVEIGGLGLGYNVVLSPAIELITELRVDLPQRDEAVGINLMVGFIATLPGGERP